MASIAPDNVLIDENDTKYKAAVSEATGTKMGATINFISSLQHTKKSFFVNGPYRVGTSLDGAEIFLRDAEIVGYSLYNTVAGLAGDTTFDLRVRTSSGGAGVSLLTTLPIIPSSAGNDAFICEEFFPVAQVLEQVAGSTLAVFNTTIINAGDMVTADILSAQTGYPINCGINIYHRPR